MHSERCGKTVRMLLAGFVLLLALAPTLSHAGQSAGNELEDVWQRVAQSGAYRFTADMTQTNAPQATIVNTGRQSTQSAMHMEGATDIAAESMQLKIWTNGGSILDPASGVEIQVQGNTAQARSGQGPWEEIEGFNGLFAPGGDPMAYTKAATNVVRHPAERRNTAAGPVQVTRYTFEIDGRRFAVQMQEALRAEALRAGLPAHVQTTLPRAYVEMSGTGELWVGADGLPLRQTFDLAFPPDQHDYVTTATMTTDFFDFDPVPAATLGYRVERGLSWGWGTLTRMVWGRQAMSMWMMTILSLLLVGLIIRRRRAHAVYAAVASSMIVSMVAVPLLNSRQLYAYSADQAAQRERYEGARAEREARAELTSELPKTNLSPNVAPLEAAQQQASLSGDVSRYFDPLCETDPAGDADGDTLTNLEECLLGTLLDAVDTDQDGAPDNVEVVGFVMRDASNIERTWYTDPLAGDTNNDGIPDGKEWLLDLNGDGRPEDTDGNGIPDIWDDDNDGDGVRDKYDLSPYDTTLGAQTFSGGNPLALSLNELVADELVKVEFQLRPTNADHLWYSQNVLDWPLDYQGQIQDADGKTFYDVDNTLDPNPNANGDVRLVPMLEIEISGSDTQLPPEETLNEFGIAVQEVVTDTTYMAYVPLQLVSDSTGDANIAFYGRMFYEPGGAWDTAHDVRMVWVVEALNDTCTEYQDGTCTEYDLEKMNQVQVVQTYADDWYLTGLHVTEEHSADIALIYEDPAATGSVAGSPANYDKPLYIDTLFGLFYGLDKTFLAGSDCGSGSVCTPDGSRDITVDTIYDRFNHATNGAVSDTQRWNLPNVLTVEKTEYESIDIGMLNTTITKTVEVLDSAFTGVWSESDPITPTVMLAYEQSYRSLNLDEGAASSPNLVWNDNSLAVNFFQSGDNAIATDTLASVKWTPYAYDQATGWAAADINAYYDLLGTLLAVDYAGKVDPDQVYTYQTITQVTYLTAYSGENGLVEIDGEIISLEQAEPDEPIAIDLSHEIGDYTIEVIAIWFEFSELYETWEELARLEAVADYAEFYGIELQPQLDALKELSGAASATIGVMLLVASVTAFIVESTVHDHQAADGAEYTVHIAAVIASAKVLYETVRDVYVVATSLVEAGTEANMSLAFVSTLTEASDVLEAGTLLPVLGLILAVGVALGMFIYASANGDVHRGSIEYNELAAETVGAIIVALILFLLTASVVGLILVAIVALVDAFLALLDIHWSITGWLAKGIADIVYYFELYVKDPEVETEDLETEFADPDAGLVSGNSIRYTLPLKTTLTEIRAGTYSDDPSKLLDNSLIYLLWREATTLSTKTGARVDDWNVSGESTTKGWVANVWVEDEPHVDVTLQAGINKEQTIYLSSAYALEGDSCWVEICKRKTVAGNSSTLLSDGIVFDVFPTSLNQFVDVTTFGWNKGAIKARDADGDGLLSARYGGLDPDDTTWDADGDGLSDAYELKVRALSAEEGGENLSPLVADGDNDLIGDGDELRWGTNPDNGDSDGDGILDIQEIGFLVDSRGDFVFGGWELPYSPGKSTRAWSDPLSTDVDQDGLSDLFERTEDTCPTCDPFADPNNPVVFNPKLWNANPVALYIEDSSGDGFVAPGETIAYTTTTANNLSASQELAGALSLSLPASFNLTGGSTEQAVDVTPGNQESLRSTIQAINTSTSMTGTLVSTMRLTDFATTTWAWDTPQTDGVTPGGTVQELASTPVSGWSQPSLVVMRETLSNGIQRIAAYQANSSGITGGESPGPQAVFSGDSGDTLTAPAIACADDGGCLVAVGVNAAGTPGQIWTFWLNKRFPNLPAKQLVWAAASDIAVSAPTVASNGTDFLVGWSATDGNGYVDYVSSVGIPNVDVSPAKIVDGHHPSDMTLAVSDDGYLASWVQNGNLARANLEVTVDQNLATISVSGTATIGAGGGWTNGAPVRHVYDLVSRQSLLLYRSSDARLHGRILSASGTGDPIEIDAAAGDTLTGNGVQTALCADPKNGGWIAAWSSPADNTTYYQAMGPDGARRGDVTSQTGSGTPLTLLCNAAQPVLDIEFDESRGFTEFIDASGSEHNATCSGSCPEAGVGGRFGNAVRFNGIDQALNIANSGSFNFGADEDFTVSFWVIADADQPTQSTPDNDIVEKWSGSGGYPYVVRYDNTNGKVLGARYDGSANPTVTSTDTINDGAFHHVAFVKRDDYLYLYVDGQQSGPRVEDTTTNDTTNDAPLYLGKRGNDGNHFAGTLDALRIYDRALSVEEIGGVFDATSAIYDLDEVAGSQGFVDSSGNELNGSCTEPSCPTMGVPGVAYTAAKFDGEDDYIEIDPFKKIVRTYRYDFESGVGAEWSNTGTMDLEFDEAAGATTFADASGFDNHASCSAGTCPQSGVSGRWGSGLDFNADGQYLTTGNFITGLSRGDFAISAWIKTTGTNMSIVAKADDDTTWESGESSFYLNHNGVPTFATYGDHYINGNIAVNDDQWHHVVVTWAYGQNPRVAKIYVDGVDRTASSSYSPNVPNLPSATFQIGRSYFGESQNYFRGSMDQVRVYSRFLEATEVSDLYSTGNSRGSQMYAADGFPDNPLGNYYLGQFANETVRLHLTDLPLHDTVKINYQLVANGGGASGWDGNSTDGGPDNFEWGYGDTSLFRTNFGTLDAYSGDLPTGNYQAFPGPASAFEGRPSGRFNMCDRDPKTATTELYCGIYGPVGDNLILQLLESSNLAIDLRRPPGAGNDPAWGDFSSTSSSNFVVRTYNSTNFAGTSTTFDAQRTVNELHKQLPGGLDPGVPPWPANVVSSYKTWTAAHDPRSGHIYWLDFGDDRIGPPGLVFPLDGTTSDHTANELTLYFQGDTSVEDPAGAEKWGLDNVEVTLEQDDTSIPLTNSSFTIAAWAKRGVEGKNMFIFSQGKALANQGLHFGFRASNRFTCAFYGDDLNTDPVTWDDEWHHWTCTYDAATKQRTIYRDGVQVASDTAAGNYTGLGPSYIGKLLDVTELDGQNPYFKGEIDEVGVWRDALSAGEVLELYNKVKVEDQSVMTVLLATTDDAGSTLRTDSLALRETATRAGTVVQNVPRVLTIDADQPSAEIESFADNQYVNNDGVLIVGGSATDPTSYVASVEINAGGQGNVLAYGTETWSYSWDLSGLGEGRHTVRYQVTDAVGNVATGGGQGIIIDRTPPNVTIDHGNRPPRPRRNDQGRWVVPLSGSAPDPAAGGQPGSGLASVEVLLAGTGGRAGLAWQPATLSGDQWTIDYLLPAFGDSGLSMPSPTGHFTLFVRASDQVGNTTPATNYASADLTLDEDGPEVALVNPSSDVDLIDRQISLTGLFTDTSGVSSIELSFVPAAQVDALGGAVANLPFDDASEPQYFNDQSGGGNAAVCPASDCPQVLETGKQGGALQLNGVNQYAYIPNSDSINFAHNQDFTVAVWIKPGTQADTQNADNDIVEKWSGDGGYPFVIRYNRTSGKIQAARFDGSNQAGLTSATSINDGAYHHVAFVKRGDSLFLYVDGEQSGDSAIDTTTGDTTNDSPLYLGVRGNLANYFTGELDELLIYDRGLADYEVANLFAYGSRTWTAATVNSGAWTYTIPEGKTGLEGIYQINVRGIDTLGNITPQSGQRLWRGQIDTKPPVVDYKITNDQSGAIPSTTYTCKASDFNLVQDQSCLPAGPVGIPTYRPADMTTTTYDQVDAWYAATITDTSRLYAIDATRVYTESGGPGQAVEACDLFGHCTTVEAELAAAPQLLAGGETLSPASGTVLTSLDPVMVHGDAYADTGLQSIIVRVNERPVFLNFWTDDDTTQQAWSFSWLPPGEGIYEFVLSVDDWAGEIPLGQSAQLPEESEKDADAADEGDGPDFPPQAYLPFASNNGAFVNAQGGIGTDIYLPIVESTILDTAQYTGTVALIYVDLAPPVVALDKNEWDRADALGARIIQLTGTVSDSLAVHRVDVRVDDGPWHRAGVHPDGHWQWPWIFPEAPDGQSFLVTARATDLAGSIAEVTEEVTVDLVAPRPGDLSYSYVNGAGATLPMEPGDAVTDAVRLQVTWGAATDNGNVTYEAGFGTSIRAADADLTAYDGPGTHSVQAGSQQGWYATVRIRDAVGNTSNVTAGPFHVE